MEAEIIDDKLVITCDTFEESIAYSDWLSSNLRHYKDAGGNIIGALDIGSVMKSYKKKP